MVDDQWPSLLALLPADFEQSAKDAYALERRRGVRSAGDLLRLVFAYSLCGMSLRECAAWARQSGVAHISDVALLKRLEKCGDWLCWLLSCKLAERIEFPDLGLPQGSVRIVDASGVSCPGSTGTDWRVHLSYDAGLGCIDFVNLTTVKTGESLQGFPVRPGETIICDRGYAHRIDIWQVVKAQADIVVRVNLRAVPLLDGSGDRFDILEHLRALGDGEVGEWDVVTAPIRKKGIPPIAGRLVAMRKSADAASRAKRKRVTKSHRRKQEPGAETLESAEYILVFTTIPRQRVSAGEILELFRFRWQIEIAFKRMKSILCLDEMAAKSPELCRTFLLAKLLSALLVDDLMRRVGAFSPWGSGCASACIAR